MVRIGGMDRESLNKFKASIIQQLENNPDTFNNYILNIDNTGKITEAWTYENIVCFIFMIFTTIVVAIATAIYWAVFFITIALGCFAETSLFCWSGMEPFCP